MAIDSFNLAQALNSQSYAFKCWNNYYYGNNTMGISSKDMGAITQTWNSELANWKAVALNDENAYDIPDDDFSKSYDDGKAAGQEATGYDGSKGGMIIRGSGDLLISGGTAALSVVPTGIQVGTKSVANAAAKAGGLAGDAAASAGKTLAKGSNASWIIGAPLNLLQGTLYMLQKPNKTQKEACDTLQDTMAESQAATIAAQEEMTSMGEEIMALSDEAASYNEDANEQIKEEKTEYDMYMASFMALKQKAESGETLTEEEKTLYKELGALLTESGENIGETQDDVSDTVTGIYDDMGSYQDGYDYAAETAAEIQGITDFAESFDSATQTMCYVEGAAQTLNAASAAANAWKAGAFAMSGSWAFGATAWAWAFVAMAAAGGAMSGVGAAEQFKWAGEVGTEIEARKATQELNTTTTEMYDTEIDNYNGWMSGVEELELDIPDEIGAPEDTELPGGTATGEEAASAAAGFGLAAATEETDDKKKEEKAEPGTGVS